MFFFTEEGTWTLLETKGHGEEREEEDATCVGTQINV